MLVDTIQAELVRLQLHSVNLSVASDDDRMVTLRGSLLQYWKLPPRLDGQWLLTQLQGLGDAAGPEAVMSRLVTGYAEDAKSAKVGKSKSQLRLFDPKNQISVK